MKSVQKNISVVLAVLSAVLFMAVLCMRMPAAAADAQMQQAGVSWSLEKGKKVSFYTAYEGLGLKKITGTVTGLTIRNSSRSGYKEAVIKVKITWPKLTKAQAMKIINSGKYYDMTGDFGSGVWTDVTDYDTGIYLGKKNSLGVSAYWKDWSYGGQYKLKLGDYGTWTMYRTATRSVFITYPENYTGLCFGIHGSTTARETENDRQFRRGKASFLQTTYRGGKKRTACFMRIG